MFTNSKQEKKLIVSTCFCKNKIKSKTDFFENIGNPIRQKIIKILVMQNNIIL